VSALRDHLGQIIFGGAMWAYALTGRCPKGWRFT
jgi:hypothetical protein